MARQLNATTPALVVRDLSKRFGAREVFAGVSFTVDPGQALLLVGPSGTGKSTLLRCLNGLERPDGGRVETSGRVGMIFQQWHLFSHRTVLENVMEGPRWVQKVALSEARARAESLLNDVEIAHRAAAYPRELSGGEQQRAAIARALAMEPRVLLMDEPTSALDDARVAALVGLLARLLDRGLALVAVTHDPRLADALPARRAELSGGRWVEVPGQGKG